MTRRTSITVPGLDHGPSPFPIATKSGPFIFSSALSGQAPDDDHLPDDIESQARNAFDNMSRVVTAAGGTVDDITKVVVFALDRTAARAAINGPWQDMFPDADSRPVRHTVEAELPPGFQLQVEFIAIQEVSPS